MRNKEDLCCTGTGGEVRRREQANGRQWLLRRQNKLQAKRRGGKNYYFSKQWAEKLWTGSAKGKRLVHDIWWSVEASGRAPSGV